MIDWSPFSDFGWSPFWENFWNSFWRCYVIFGWLPIVGLCAAGISWLEAMTALGVWMLSILRIRR